MAGKFVGNNFGQDDVDKLVSVFRIVFFPFRWRGGFFPSFPNPTHSYSSFFRVDAPRSPPSVALRLSVRVGRRLHSFRMSRGAPTHHLD